MKYNYHLDPGHGWLEVPYSEIVQLGIKDKISQCSYRKGDTCYLEEDCDFSKFTNAYEAKYGNKIEIEYVYHTRKSAPPCFIRNLNHYRAL